MTLFRMTNDGTWPDAVSALDRAFVQFLQTTEPSSDERHAWLAALTSYQMGRGHACLDLLALNDSPAVLLGWTAQQALALPVQLAQASSSMPWTVGEGSPLVLEGTRLYLRRAYQAEQTVKAALRARLAQPPHELVGLRQDLNALFPPATDAQHAIDWQKVACAIAARSCLTLITGGPGTGKTTTVVRLLALLTADARQRGQSLRIRLAAPTGKAASRLGESIQSAVAHLPAHLQIDKPAEPETLHRLLQFTPDAPLREVPTLTCDLVVVDEASMIDLEMMARLLTAVPLTARLILLGDKDQLASVEAGAVMAQLCEGAAEGGYSADTAAWIQAQTGQDVQACVTSRRSGSALAQQTVMLRHSRRFDADSGIGQWAQAVNAGDVNAVRTLAGQCPSVQDTLNSLFAPDVDQLNVSRLPHPAWAQCVRQGWSGWLNQLAPLRADDAACSDVQAMQLIQGFSDFQVLCALRNGPWGVTQLNLLMGRLLGLGSQDWYTGRPVMVTRNDANLKLMNGDVGLCLPTATGLRVAFAHDGHVRWVLPSRLDAVETVWAMTVHKSQGSEFAHVMLVLPDKPSPVLTRELIYTGITRAKKRLTLLLASQSVLLQATAARVLRSGGLSELTEENFE
jgi:exodeoxyribonuclease V alpha subunit